MKKIAIRILFYIAGLFVVTLGIATSIKSGLGVSPVTSIPYTVEKITGILTGRVTIVFYLLLVILQIVLLRKKFKIKNLLQIPVAVLFGYFTDLSVKLLGFVPSPEHIGVQLLTSFIGIILVAIGLFFYVPADIVPLPPDGTIKTIAELTKSKFPNVKIVFDTTVVSLSLVGCLLFLKPFSFSNMSVGIGTVLAAIFVGFVLGILNKWFGQKRDILLK